MRFEEADVLLVLLFLRTGSCGGGSFDDVDVIVTEEASGVAGSNDLGVVAAFALSIGAMSSIALLIAALTSASVEGWTGGHGLLWESGVARTAFGDVEFVGAMLLLLFDGVGAPKPGKATLELMKDPGLMTLGTAGEALGFSRGLITIGSLTLGGLEAACSGS